MGSGEVEPPDGWEAAPLPAGARDVLPVEAAELRGLEAALRAAVAPFGYLEVMTPVLELAAVMDRAQEGGLGRAFRLFDDHGRVLVLRPDLTIPVSRLVASRLAEHPGPVRVCYVEEAFRPPRPGRAQAAEERQAGAELVGLAGPAADAEVIGVLVEALRRAGLHGFRVGVGDVALTAAVVEALGVREPDRARLRAAAGARSFVAWRRVARRLGLPEAERGLLADLPTLRGGAEVLARVAAVVPAAADECRHLEEMLALLAGHDAADVTLVDLGVMRDWPYYSGVVFEAYAPGVGAPVAMGGRYDGLGARFGRPRPAVGFGITLERLHRAVAVRAGAATPPRDGVVLVGGLDAELQAARAARRAGTPVVALPAGDPDAEALAEADGWRWVARPEEGGYAVLDRTSGERHLCPDLEALRSPG